MCHLSSTLKGYVERHFMKISLRYFVICILINILKRTFTQILENGVLHCALLV